MLKKQYLLIILIISIGAVITSNYFRRKYIIEISIPVNVKKIYEIGSLYIIDENNNMYSIVEANSLRNNSFINNISYEISDIIMENVKDITYSSDNQVYLLDYDGNVYHFIDENNYRYKPLDNLPKISKIRAGENFCIALSIDGNVWAWGSNEKGQLGTNTYEYHFTPIKITFENSIIDIESGYDNVIALDKNYDVWAWGDNKYGRCGLDGDTIISKPTKLEIPEKIIKISSGNTNSLALGESGLVYSWGDTVEVLGKSRSQNSNKPARIMDLKNITAMSMRYSKPTAIAIDSEGNIFLWGFTYNYRIFSGSIPFKYEPMRIYSSNNIILATPISIGVVVVEENGNMKLIRR